VVSVATRDPVLVTGAGGFLGTRLVPRLARAGYSVLALTSPRNPKGRWLVTPDNVEVVSLDLRFQGLLVDLIRARRIRSVIHLAAVGVLGPASFDDLLDVNVRALVAMAEAIRGSEDHRLLAAGTVFEYGAPGATPIDESAPLRPLTAYAVSKAVATFAAQAAAAENGLRFAMLRLFHLFGPGEAPTRLIPYVIRKMEARAPVETTDLQAVRDLVYVDDAAEAFCRALESEQVIGHVVNVASGRGTKLCEVLEFLADRLDARGLLRIGARPSRAVEAPHLVGNPEAARRLMGWEAAHRWEEAVAAMVGARRRVSLERA
jgi:nucleoside-diphosphate-sugar epimerase